jgi:glycine dehydrogenase
VADHASLTDLDAALPFVERHIGLRPDDVEHMLRELGFASLDELMAAAVPETIAATRPLDLPPPTNEDTVARELRAMAARNRPAEAMIGLGYHPSVTPGVIRRRVLESPAWYTAYTPYQPEISQGRLEALLNFQTVIGDLTGLPTANASLLEAPRCRPCTPVRPGTPPQGPGRTRRRCRATGTSRDPPPSCADTAPGLPADRTAAGSRRC